MKLCICTRKKNHNILLHILAVLKDKAWQLKYAIVYFGIHCQRGNRKTSNMRHRNNKYVKTHGDNIIKLQWMEIKDFDNEINYVRKYNFNTKNNKNKNKNLIPEMFSKCFN